MSAEPDMYPCPRCGHQPWAKTIGAVDMEARVEPAEHQGSRCWEVRIFRGNEPVSICGYRLMFITERAALAFAGEAMVFLSVDRWYAAPYDPSAPVLFTAR